MPEETPTPVPDSKTTQPSETPAPPVPDLPPPVSPNLTKAELAELLDILDRGMVENIKFRNEIAKMLGVEGKTVPVLPIAPTPSVPNVPLEPVCPDSMIERGELIRQAIREEVAHGNKILNAKVILERYQPRWGWKPSEATIQRSIEQVLNAAKAPAVPTALATVPIPPVSPASGKKSTPHETILSFLSVTEYRTYKDLSEKVMGAGFTLELFSDAYSELNAKGLVVEEGIDKIRKAK